MTRNNCGFGPIDNGDSIADLQNRINKLKEKLKYIISKQNARITELETEVADLTAQVADLTAQVADLTAQVADLTTQVADLTARVTDLETRVTDLETRVTYLETGSFATFGIPNGAIVSTQNLPVEQIIDDPSENIALFDSFTISLGPGVYIGSYNVSLTSSFPLASYVIMPLLNSVAQTVSQGDGVIVPLVISRTGNNFGFRVTGSQSFFNLLFTSTPPISANVMAGSNIIINRVGD